MQPFSRSVQHQQILFIVALSIPIGASFDNWFNLGRIMAGKIFQDIQEVHYCQLESQSNIYGLAKLAVSQYDNKLLVASLRGKVMSMAFQKTAPSSREVTFTYIPGKK
jgi:hypothetical protein